MCYAARQHLVILHHWEISLFTMPDKRKQASFFNQYLATSSFFLHLSFLCLFCSLSIYFEQHGMINVYIQAINSIQSKLCRHLSIFCYITGNTQLSRMSSYAVALRLLDLELNPIHVSDFQYLWVKSPKGTLQAWFRSGRKDCLPT